MAVCRGHGPFYSLLDSISLVAWDVLPDLQAWTSWSANTRVTQIIQGDSYPVHFSIRMHSDIEDEYLVFKFIYKWHYSKILPLAFRVFIAHKDFQSRYPLHHFMLKGRQFGHYSHQTGILTFHADLFFNPYFFTLPSEQFIGLIMGIVPVSKQPVSQV